MGDTESHQHLIVDLQKRISRVEGTQSEMVRLHYELTSDFAGIQRDVAHIRESQDRVSSGVNKILWAIALSVVGAFSTFVMSGGLVIVQ